MIKKSTGNRLLGIAAILTLVFSTIMFFIPVLIVGLLKLFPNVKWKVKCTQLVDEIVAMWSDVNNLFIKFANLSQWQLKGLTNFDSKKWYLVIANHQSWLDIVVLQYVLNRKIPMFKFFIKDQLKWVPLLGFAWWAMGCPFMKRYSRDYLAKNPHKKGKDLAATRQALRLFKKNPVSVTNFIEGTRLTPNKHEMQQSPYQCLLKPKAGGISFVISSMPEIDTILDVSLVYSNQSPSLWDFLCRRMDKITVHMREIPIPEQFRQADVINNAVLQAEFRTWLNQYWHEKDALITKLRHELAQDSSAFDPPVCDESLSAELSLD